MTEGESAVQNSIASQIGQILEARRARVPRVEHQLEQLRAVDRHIAQLEVALDEFVAVEGVPGDVKSEVSTFRNASHRAAVARSVEVLQAVKGRMSRDAVNIGVSGQARVGKSSLLQGISGLGDNQVPTGSGVPVTAVRSRIVHSAHERAVVKLRTYETFAQQVIAPLHLALDLGPAPGTLDEFRRHKYPSEGEVPKNVELTGRLRAIHRALPSYEALLTGETRMVALTDLRSYVAYPTNEEQNDPGCRRVYLAVEDVRIECPFPRLDAERIALVDLPGLGEASPSAEDHHVQGLKHEVDLVLVVKRPVQGLAFWGDKDVKALNLLDKARGAIKVRGDFVLLVVNAAPHDAPELVRSLRDDIRRQVNEGVDDRHFTVLHGDACSPDDLRGKILGPALEHLARRLGAMDDNVFDDAMVLSRNLADGLDRAHADLKRALDQVPRVTGPEDEVFKRANELREDLAVALHDVVQDLWSTARESSVDSAFVGCVERVYQDILAWIEGGFGRGQEKWCSEAYRSMRSNKTVAKFAVDELNHIRVEISRRFCEIDVFFDAEVQRLQVAVGRCFLSSGLGGLLGDKQGREALEALKTMLAEVPGGCDGLLSAVDDLLRLEIRYRAQLHPRVRRALDQLTYQAEDPVTHEPSAQLLVPVTDAGAELLYRRVCELAEQGAYEVQKALLGEAVIHRAILHASAEQFDDSVCRARTSDDELRRFARAYRHEIWPDVFRDIDIHSARSAKIRRELNGLAEGVKSLRSGGAA